MPIKFRCPRCQQFLGISRDKAGEITDCPTCGRTIRVPQLDGTVPPLPKAGLNLADSDLTHALDALARLNEASSPIPLQEPESEQPSVRAPAPRPEPVPLERAPAPVRSSAAAEPRPAADRIARSIDPLAELARLTESVPPPKRPRVLPDQRAHRLMLISCGAAGFLSFATGFFVGRMTLPRADKQAGSPVAGEARDHGGAGEAAAAAMGRTSALTGRITFEAAGAGQRADAGARILVLPADRHPETQLPAPWFLAGASATDHQPGRDALRTLGGDYAIADDEGRYAISLSEAGTYQVLLISRHQSRDALDKPPEGVLGVLGGYIQQPATLLGAVAYDMRELRFDGTTAAPRDHTFGR